jgi:hypothetical protein
MPKFYCYILLFRFISLDTYCQKRLFLQNPLLKPLLLTLTNEQAWITNANIATDFIMFEPDNGKPINENKEDRSKGFIRQ